MLAARGRKIGAVIVMALVSCVNAPSGEAGTRITPPRGTGTTEVAGKLEVLR
jgi:hypothetical protein